MRVRRMTLVLPARLRGMAEHEARRIAQEAAAWLGYSSRGSMRFEVAGKGLSGHALSGAVGRAVGARTGGRD
jgi:hypothetical protein